MSPSPQPVAGTCRVCGSRDIAPLCRTYNEHSQTRWLDNCRCRDCGSVFVANTLTVDELGEAYATLDEKAYYAETAKASEEKFRAAAHELAKMEQPTAEVIDIGGGNGAFLRALEAQGFANLSIHEIPGEDISGLSGVRRIYRDSDYATIPSASFDVVTMMDVMEHVVSPTATIAAARRILRPNGLLYVHTPVVTSLDRIMHFLLRLPWLSQLARAWQRARTSVFHLQNYTPSALTQLMHKEGFRVVKMQCINELSWPLERYVRVYLVDKMRMPHALVPTVVFTSSLFVRSRLHANKGVLAARRIPD